MSRRGSILMMVLFAMGVLSLLAMSVAYRAGLQSRMSRDRAVMAQLKAQAASGVAVAMGRLSENTNDYDHPAEPWHVHAPLGAEDWLEEWSAESAQSGAAFTADYQVIDEERKLHVAFASSAALEKLGMSPMQIASLFDWMDEDGETQADGAEDEYYLNLASPYYCKNGPLDMLDELLLVRGFGAADYWGEDVNHDGSLDRCEDDGGMSYPPDDADGQLQPGWVDLLTCVGNGRINLNTAPLVVLKTLPLSDGAAEQIRRFAAGGDAESHAFRSEEDIEQLQGLSDADRAVLTGIARYRSRHFRIFSQAVHRPTGMRYHLEVLVRAGESGLEILQWKAGH